MVHLSFFRFIWKEDCAVLALGSSELTRSTARIEPPKFRIGCSPFVERSRTVARRDLEKP